MKKLLLTIAFIFIGINLSQAQENEIKTFDLTIEIEGIENNKGKIYIAIYDSDLLMSITLTVFIQSLQIMAYFVGIYP